MRVGLHLDIGQTSGLQWKEEEEMRSVELSLSLLVQDCHDDQSPGSELGISSQTKLRIASFRTRAIRSGGGFPRYSQIKVS